MASDAPPSAQQLGLFCTRRIAFPEGPLPTPTQTDLVFLAVCGPCSAMFADTAAKYNIDASDLAPDFIRMNRQIAERRRLSQEDSDNDNDNDNDIQETSGDNDNDPSVANDPQEGTANNGDEADNDPGNDPQEDTLNV